MGATDYLAPASPPSGLVARHRQARRCFSFVHLRPPSPSRAWHLVARPVGRCQASGLRRWLYERVWPSMTPSSRAPYAWEVDYELRSEPRRAVKVCAHCGTHRIPRSLFARGHLAADTGPAAYRVRVATSTRSVILRPERVGSDRPPFTGDRLARLGTSDAAA